MGTTIDAVAAVRSRAPGARSDARRLADRAAKVCLDHAGLARNDVDLLLNAGIFHHRLMGEPALAALIQEDIGANPEDPHPGHHGTFSFDVANGGCGMLSALQVADGFLTAGTIEHALVVASDSHPGQRWAGRFPYVAAGGALSCSWSDGPDGIVGFRFGDAPDPDGHGRATVALDRGRNRLHITESATFVDRSAELAARLVAELLAEHGLDLGDIGLVAANPLQPAFLDALADRTGLVRERIVSAPAHARVHTAGLAFAVQLARRDERLRSPGSLLLVSAGAGLVAGTALIRLR